MGGFDQGFAFGASVAQQKAAHQQAYTDQEHDAYLNGYNTSESNIRQRMAQVGDKSSEYPALQQQLNQVIADRTALFHPNRPGGLERLGKMLWNKVHGESTPDAAPARIAETPIAGTQGTTLPGMNGGMNVTSPTLPATSVARDTLPNTPTVIPTAGEAKARYAQDISFGLHPENPLLTFRKNVMEAIPDLPPEHMDALMKIQAGLAPKPVMLRPAAPHWQSYKLNDGTFKMFNLNDPNEQPPHDAMPVTAQTTPRPSMASMEQSIRSWFPNGTTPQQREWAIRRYQGMLHPDTTSAHDAIGYDSQGNPVPYRLTSTNQKDYGADGPPPPNADGSSPQFSSVAAAAPAAGATPAGAATLSGQPITVAKPATATAAPRTAGEARKRASAVKAGGVPTGAPAAPSGIAALHKNTPAQTTADKKVGDFTALSKLADLAEAAPSDAVKQRSLILALIRASAGRVNMQEYDSYAKKQGLENNIEQWANNTKNGALPADILRKIISVTRDYMAGAQAEQREAYKGTNVAGKNGSGADSSPAEDTSAPPAEVVAKAAEGQFIHGPGGTYKKINGKAVKQ